MVNAQSAFRGSPEWCCTHNTPGKNPRTIWSSRPVLETIPQVPPTGNTGALNTKTPVEVLVDHLEGTFQDLSLKAVKGLFSGELEAEDGWEALPCGRNGYKQGVVRGSIRIYWDGQQGMGVHVCATGQGCRQLEEEGFTWEGPDGLFCTLHDLRFDASRIDLALDEKGGLLTPGKITQKVLDDETVTRFQAWELRTSGRFGAGRSGEKAAWAADDTESDHGWSLYCGGASSRARVRIYDKAAERRAKGDETFAGGPWMRCELQLRDERAQEVVSLLALGAEQGERVSLGALVAGRLYAYLDFKTPDGDSNRSRWRTCDWWVEFMAGVEKIRTFSKQPVRTVQKAAEWVRRQVAPALALLHLAEGYGAEFIAQAVRDGEERLQGWQLAAIMKPKPYEPVAWGGI